MRFTRLFSVVISGMTALSLATPAFAVLPAPFGWYVDGNLGISKLSDDNYTGSTDSSGYGGSVDFGYKFMPYFTTELGYTRYANIDIKNSAGTKAAKVQNDSLYLAGKGIVPVEGWGFELFGKLGIQRLNSRVTISDSASAASLGITSSRHKKTGLYVGAGGEYYFMPEVAVLVQWARSIGDNTTGTLDLYSIGLSLMLS